MLPSLTKRAWKLRVLHALTGDLFRPTKGAEESGVSLQWLRPDRAARQLAYHRLHKREVIVTELGNQ